MKIKISTYKFIDELGEKRVHIEVEESGKYTNRIFKSETDFRLRDIGNNGALYEAGNYSSFVNAPVNDDKDIDKLIEQIVDLYRKLDQKKWSGAKDYIIEI